MWTVWEDRTVQNLDMSPSYSLTIAGSDNCPSTMSVGHPGADTGLGAATVPGARGSSPWVTHTQQQLLNRQFSTLIKMLALYFVNGVILLLHAQLAFRISNFLATLFLKIGTYSASFYLI